MEVEVFLYISIIISCTKKIFLKLLKTGGWHKTGRYFPLHQRTKIHIKSLVINLIRSYRWLSIYDTIRKLNQCGRSLLQIGFVHSMVVIMWAVHEDLIQQKRYIWYLIIPSYYPMSKFIRTDKLE